MDERSKENFRLAMLEACLLPPGDQQREALEVRVSKLGGWAESEWRELVEETGKLRVELGRVELPPGLESRLLGLPDSPAARLFSWLPARGRLLRLAAVLVLALAAGGSFFYLKSIFGKERQLKTIAQLTINDHVQKQSFTVITLDPEYLERHLAGSVPFKIILPAVSSRFSLVGGRSCSLGAYPVVYTQWAGPQGRCSLFQFRSSDFGLPNQAGKEVIPSAKVDCPEAWRHACKVVVWSEGGRGYALVADRADSVECISAGSR